MSTPPIIVWFTHDLRVRDNYALHEAARTGHPIIPLYIVDKKAGGASRWWLGQSLSKLSSQLSNSLLVREGDYEDVLRDVMSATGATRIFRNKVYEPDWRRRDKDLSQRFPITYYQGNVLSEPKTVMTKTGTPFKVFTPFYNALLTHLNQPKPVLPAPKSIKFHAHCMHNDIHKFIYTPHWAAEFDKYNVPGENGAYAQLTEFCDEGLESYKIERDFPAFEGTSRLSAYLHFGEISAREIWSYAQGRTGSEAYLRQIAWREFAIHLLYHFPDTVNKPLDPKFTMFPWQSDARYLNAWQTGMTGYPIIDAGMRQLWKTGWMHNRLRMITGSFLVKHLLQPWQDGLSWFDDCLVDADQANNVMGWQWIAGCGADAAPYFRVFNPVIQGQRFDPKGEFVREFVPEVAHLDNKFIHTPWLAGGGRDGYPAPIVSLEGGRERALAAYGKLKHNMLP